MLIMFAMCQHTGNLVGKKVRLPLILNTRLLSSKLLLIRKKMPEAKMKEVENVDPGTESMGNL